MTARDIANKAGLVEGVDYSLTSVEPFTDGITIDQFVFYLNAYNTPAQRKQRIDALMGKGGVLEHFVGGNTTSNATSFTLGDFIPPTGGGSTPGGVGSATGNSSKTDYMVGEQAGQPNKPTGKGNAMWSVAYWIEWAKANKGLAALAAVALFTIIHRMFSGRWWWKKRRKKG